MTEFRGVSTARGVGGQVLGAAVGLDLHDPATDAPLRRVMDEPAAEQIDRETGGGAVEPGRLDGRMRLRPSPGHQRRAAISSGTKGRMTKPTIGMTLSRKKPTISESFSPS